MKLFVAFCCFALATVWGEEKKSQPPTPVMSVPLSLSRTPTNALKIRGLFLTNTVRVALTPPIEGVQVLVRGSGKAEVPKGMEAKTAGDTQLDLELVGVLPTALQEVRVSMSMAEATNPPVTWTFPIRERVEVEQGPTGSFRKAQKIQLGTWVRGSIQEAGNVDVYQVELEKGRAVRVSLVAAELRSPLDGVISVYDLRGHLLASCDDARADKTDPSLSYTPAAAGPVLIVVTDALDRGSVLHLYELRVSAEEGAGGLVGELGNGGRSGEGRERGKGAKAGKVSKSR